MGDSRIRLHQWDEDRSEFEVPPCELDGEGGEYEVEVTPVFEVSRAKEGGSEPSICKQPLCGRLCDRTLPRPGQSVQPIDWRPVEILRPKVDLV